MKVRPGLLDVPRGRPRPGVRSVRSDEVAFALDNDMWAHGWTQELGTMAAAPGA